MALVLLIKRLRSQRPAAAAQVIVRTQVPTVPNSGQLLGHVQGPHASMSRPVWNHAVLCCAMLCYCIYLTQTASQDYLLVIELLLHYI